MKAGITVVVDRDDGHGRMRLLRRHALVDGDGVGGCEAAAFHRGQEFIVAERRPIAEIGGFDHDTAKLMLEWLAQERRHADNRKHLPARSQEEAAQSGLLAAAAQEFRYRSGRGFTLRVLLPPTRA